MVQIDSDLSTGLGGLDRVLTGLIPGDNIVWQVDSAEDYARFVDPYARKAVAGGRTLIYFRFATHRPLLAEDCGAEIHQLRPEEGFETFLRNIHRVIEEKGRGAFYIFDCLSELAADWYSDRMLGNFFRLTCPYLYDLETITYFALLRDYHSVYATGPISDTTQLLLDVYHHKGDLYVRPVKVEHRWSPRMHMLHVWRGDEFLPVMESATAADVLTSVPWVRLGSAGSRLGVWTRAFLEAEQALEEIRSGDRDAEEETEYCRRLLRMSVSRDDRVLKLAQEYMGLEDLLEIGNRMIGTGLIGGKSVGMLLARAILAKTDRRWPKLLEPHDSFYIGSDVFYTFLVRNGVWWVRNKQRDPGSFMDGAERARQRILTGTFPEHIEKQFSDMLDYFGQSPIIVRSSSLLEDNFGNAFAGKYDSFFCANQGRRQERMAEFLSAVRRVYASTMSERALVYRAQRGLLERDEQMAVLVQRVSGAMYGDLFFPQLAGVALSFNPYVWNENIDPKAGVLRLVFGLGTRAVDRHDDDYTRVVALNAPDRRPEGDSPKARQYTQANVDVLDLRANQLASSTFRKIAADKPDLPIDIFSSQSAQPPPRGPDAGKPPAFDGALTFRKLLSETTFVGSIRDMLATLESVYEYPVDVELAANFLSDQEYRINLLQCRPFQVKGGGTHTPLARAVQAEHVVLQARGAVIGQSRQTPIDRFIHVVPSAYGQLPLRQRYAVARLIGKLTPLVADGGAKRVMLLGPGRWGTTMPQLGVPIAFSDINTVSVLCEIVAMRDDLIPDVSLGTHLFNDLVEMDILYLAFFPDRDENTWNRSFFEESPNRLADLMPSAAGMADIVRVIDPADLPDVKAAHLNANVLTQTAVCYVEPAS